MRDPNNPCIFCFPKKKDFIFENELAYVTKDTYTVSKFNSLIFFISFIHKKYKFRLYLYIQ